MSKILYVIDRPNDYGSEQHLFDVVNYQRRYHTVRVITFRDGPLVDKLRETGVEVEMIDWLSWLITPGKYRRFIRAIRRFGPDLVHSHQPKAAFYASLLCRLHRIPHIPTIHALPVQAAARHRGVMRSIIYAFHTCVIWATEWLSEQAIYVSRDAVDQASIRPGRAIMIHNWLSPRFSERQPSPRNDYKNRYLCVSSIDPSKGIGELIALFGRLLAEQPAAHLTIVGGGSNESYRLEIERMIRSSGLEKNITLAGHQSDLADYYNTNDVFISLTKGESFGLVFVEAMYYGMAVICSDLNILREVLHPDNLFIDPETPGIERAITAFVTSGKQAEIAAKNHEWVVERYDYEKQQRKLAEAYDRILRPAR